MDKVELQGLIDEGLSQRAIAARKGISQSTVRHYLGKYGLRTSKLPHNKVIAQLGDSIVRECSTHGLTEFAYEVGKSGYRCKKCRSYRVTVHRRGLKARLVAAAGGACAVCGYNKSSWALEFHHRDPSTKSYAVSFLVRDRKERLAFEEIKKCDLVCSNCHSEIEEASYNALQAETVQALV